MAINEGMFTSATAEWETPQDFFDTLDALFHFTLDVCATKDNTKCARFFTQEDDGLAQAWEGVCWMNPPYGREIGKWVEKARWSALEGATVVCLLPSRTDTKWFHDTIVVGGEVYFVKGRLKFGGLTNAAPFPSIVVVFRPHLKAHGLRVQGSGAVSILEDLVCK